MIIALLTASAVNAEDITSDNIANDSVIPQDINPQNYTLGEGSSHYGNSNEDDSITDDSETTNFTADSTSNNGNVLSCSNNESEIQSTVSASSANGILGTSFTDLQGYLNGADEGATLVLDCNYSLADGGHTLKVEKSLTIDGDGHTLDGNGDDCILKINEDGISVILKNIVFKNGKSDKGAAILNTHSSSALTIQDCEFKDNYARDCGGAIYSKGSVDIKDCKFNDNYGDNYGGAIYADKEVKVRDTSFDDNQAVLEGGAIYCGGKTTVINSQFRNNKADGTTTKKCYGGAIYSVGECNIDLGYFGDNYAENDGGAVYAEDNLIINESSFQKNDAKYGAGAISANKKITIENTKINKNNGYYVIEAKGKCYIISCSFDSNTAGTIVSNDNLIITGQTKFSNNRNDAAGGGAISAMKNVYINWDSDTNGYCEFYSNSGSQGLLGGAIYCEGNIYGKSMKFNKNYVPSSPKIRGGAIYCNGETHINSSVFDDNWLVIPASGIENVPVEGGAIWSEGKCYIDSCTFTDNQGGCRGGAICAYDDLTITGQNIFTKNSVYVFNLAVGICSDPDGGAIYCKGNANINNATFTSNEAIVDGGAIFCEGECTVSNSKFINNSADNGDAAVPYAEYSYGGAIRSQGTLTVKNCIFDNNYAYTDGGAIYADTAVKVTGSSFNHNLAPVDGGAIYSKGKTTLSDSTFYQNAASHVNYVIIENSYGGAVCSKGTVTVDNCSFDWNGADNYGSAIYAYSDANIKDSRFTNHITDSSGGAIYCKGDADIEYSVFSNNMVDTLDGGAIYCKGKTTVSHSVFKDNSAKSYGAARSFGGAIRSENSITVESSSFENNFAYNHGGAIYADKDITITYCNFTGNKANVDGGAVYCDGRTTISDSKFKKNNATGKTAARSFGGAVRSNGVTKVEDSIFDDNFAYNLGGAIYADASIIIGGSTFTDNEAYVDGGAVYGDKSVSISSSIFSSNEASGQTLAKSYGGAVRANELIVVIGCDFSNNYAYNRGGAVYADTEIRITDCNFTSNTAKDYGGAVYTSTLNSEVSGSIFKKNKCTSGDGGAVYINNKCSPEFYACSFKDNTAEDRGGGIYIDSKSAPLELGMSTFTGNSAGDGGAVYTGTMTESTSNCIFLNNKATSGDGGAVYINNNCDPKFISCRFEYNTAKDEGGAMYLDSSHAELTLWSCTFVDNEAKSSGQCVYCCGYYSSVYNCWFGKNDPSKKDQFKIWHKAAADEDYTEYIPTRIRMSVEHGILYVGNTYEVDVDFLKFVGGDYTILHSTGQFYAENYEGAVFSNVNADEGDMSADVTIYKQNPTLYFKLDHQILTLKLETNDKNPSKVTIISCEDVEYPNALKVEYKIINMTANATYVIVNEETSDVVHEGKIYNPESTLSVYNLKPGKYYIGIYNPGNKTTSSSRAFGHFKVYASASGSVTADNVTYGNPTTITLRTFIDGTYNVDIGVSVIEMEVVHGVCVKQINLDEGNYQTHTSRENYYLTINEASFRVDKAVNNVVVEVENITYGKSSNIKLRADLDGIYDVKINGTTYNIVVKNGIGNKSIQFKAGKYYANVSFYDKNFITLSKNTTFEVYKADIDLVVIVFDEVYGEQIEAVVYASMDGEYNLTIAGDLTHVTVKDNFAYFEHAPLDAGNYNASVSFAGNSNYNPASSNTTFTVYTTGTLFKLEVYPSEISYGETATVTHTLSDGATGTIKYFLNDGTFLAELDVNENLTLPVLDAGYYVIIGNYSGDHNFKSAKDTTYIKINPAHNNAVVTVSNVTYGEQSLIEITADVDGIYNVNVNGTVHNIIVNNGIGNKSINLNAGIYYANLTFNAKNYNTTTNNSIFEVYKADTNLIVVAAYSVYQENTSCIVYPENILGIVYSDVDGEYNLTVGNYSAILNVTGGFCEFNAGLFDADNYTVVVTFTGDENHKSNTSSTKVTVTKFIPNLSLSVQDIYYGDTALLVISCDVTGSVNVTINGRTETIDLNQWTVMLFDSSSNFIKSKTRVFLTLDNLDVGNYPVDIVYNGDNNIESVSISGQFNVLPTPNNANVTVSNVTYGEQSLIEITADVDGIYNVDINGTVYNITVENGVGNRSITLDAGVYYANLTFKDKNYNTTTHNATFEVYKAATNVFVTASNTIYPQGVEGFVYSDVDGEYNLTIGEFSTIVVVKGGSAEFNTGVLDAGNYTVVVTYPGDENHKSNSSSRKVTVEKLIPNITLKVSDIDYGGFAVITINCDIEGSVNVTVNGITETLELNGQMKKRLLAASSSASKSMYNATLSLYNLDSGSYPVTVTYNGNKNIESVSVNGKFNVNALNTTMDIDACDINVGEDEKITVTLPKDVTGNVTINVDGKNYTVAIKDGKAVISIPNLCAGHKTAKVYYSGSRNYNPNMETVSFTVNKIKPNMTGKSNDPIDSGKKIHIVIKLPTDATGTVSIVIDGKKYTSPVKAGKAIFDIEGLSAGKYNVTAYYSGDDKYYPDQIKLTLTVKDNGNNHKNHTNNDTPDNKGNNVSDIVKDKIAMHKTGVPAYWLVLALLMMVMGLLPNKRSKK
ncbi:Ig-like domain repeat protein [uncultured Methanobrevibacter sp.]|uniref:Ig-like domain repeat protein n=1 Tax=uncultured Methanobrevibacter sp. TaxID=253161 RepID=UPI0026350D30|nr:Ig-like domain repeat protein [uncultured Methanobrevibacter sp.]